MDLASTKDTLLWQQAAIGRSEVACRTLIARHKATVWNACSQILLCTDDIEEAIQVTFLALLENGDQIQSDDFGAWLYRVAYRAALRVRSDSIRKTPQATELPDRPSHDVAFHRIEEAERAQLVAQAIDTLSLKYREVLVMHYVRGMSREEVADALGTTVQTVKGRLMRARTMLRNRLVRRGISLGAVASFLMASADAAEVERVVPIVESAVKDWLAGCPVSPGRVHFSDLTGKDVGMVYRKSIWTKSTITGAGIAAVVAAFLVGRLMDPGNLNAAQDLGPLDATISQTNNVPRDSATSSPARMISTSPQTDPPVAFDNRLPGPTQQSAPAPDKASIRQASHQVQAQPEPVAFNARRPTPAVSGFTFGQPVQVSSPYQLPQPALASNAPAQAHNFPGLPEGTWVHNSPFGQVTSHVEGTQIALTISITAFPVLECEAHAEYSIASDGTIYGLIHSVGFDSSKLVGEDAEGMMEIAMMMTGLNDLPFSLRCHSGEDFVSIKSLKLGTPTAPFGMDIDTHPSALTQSVSSMLIGTFKRAPDATR